MDYSDWLYGSLDLMVLRALALGRAHGFGISTWIRQRTDGKLAIEDAALYKALHRLERQKLVVSEWDKTERNRTARYYELTAEGRESLKRQRQAWRKWVTIMDLVLEPA